MVDRRVVRSQFDMTESFQRFHFIYMYASQHINALELLDLIRKSIVTVGLCVIVVIVKSEMHRKKNKTAANQLVCFSLSS
jgi:hypothetical protein